MTHTKGHFKGWIFKNNTLFRKIKRKEHSIEEMALYVYAS